MALTVYTGTEVTLKAEIDYNTISPAGASLANTDFGGVFENNTFSKQVSVAEADFTAPAVSSRSNGLVLVKYTPSSVGRYTLSICLVQNDKYFPIDKITVNVVDSSTVESVSLIDNSILESL